MVGRCFAARATAALAATKLRADKADRLVLQWQHPPQKRPDSLRTPGASTG